MSLHVWKIRETRNHFVSANSPSTTNTYLVNKFWADTLSRKYGLRVSSTQNPDYLKRNCVYVCPFDEDNIREYKHRQQTGERLMTANPTALYEITVDEKTTKYGTYLATNAEGQWVMDVKGGSYEAFDKDKCSEVVPHSISLQTPGDKVIHVLAEKDKYKKGEVYLWHGLMYRVVEVNTKIRTTREFKPTFKFAGEVL